MAEEQTNNDALVNEYINALVKRLNDVSLELVTSQAKSNLVLKEKEHFSNLKDWSNAYNDLENWTNLNTLVAISSNFETYLATIIPLAIKSDIGVLFGATRRIDGIEIIKHGKDKPLNFDKTVENCTKGTWQSRINTYQRTFGVTPNYLKKNISKVCVCCHSKNNYFDLFKLFAR